MNKSSYLTKNDANQSIVFNNKKFISWEAMLSDFPLF